MLAAPYLVLFLRTNSNATNIGWLFQLFDAQIQNGLASVLNTTTDYKIMLKRPATNICSISSGRFVAR